MEGHTTVESVVGPMGHNLSDLRLVLKLVLDMQPWLADPKVIRLPWRQNDHDEAKSRIETKSLVFGVMRTDGFVQVHPPVRRAMDEAVAALEREGHKVSNASRPEICSKAFANTYHLKMVLWEPPSHAEAFQILVCLPNNLSARS
jgi:amidase